MTRRWTWGDDPGEVAAVLRRGGIVAVPTESSYGLAVDPESPVAVESVFEVKGRPAERALPLVAPGLAGLARIGIDVEAAPLREVAGHWPAALSVVVPARPGLPVAAADGTVAVRIPAHELLRALLAELDVVVTATSANQSGSPPVSDPDAVADLLCDHDALVVDDGPLPGGPPSTLVRWGDEGWEVLRPGRFPISRLTGAVAAPAGRAR